MKKKSYRNKHNKKRNTAFLYEVLVHETTKCVVKNDVKKKEKALKILKEFFTKGKILSKERHLFDSLASLEGEKKDITERVVFESQKEYIKLSKKEIFNEQTKLINKINKEISPSVFSNFVQNYKSLATIAQILNQELPVKERIMLESKFVEESLIASEKQKEMTPTDGLVYKTFVKNFNDKYKDSLLEEQKEIITRRAISFSDNGVSLKVFLNEEVVRLKKCLKKSLEKDVMREDNNMANKTSEVLAILESYKEKQVIDNDAIIQLLEIQNLARELEE